MPDLFNISDPVPLALAGADVVLHSDPELGVHPDTLFDTLMAELDWRQESITLFGKQMLQPRLLAWYGDPEAVYRYSGVAHKPLPWTESLLALRVRLEELLGVGFNSVLANLYRDHRDSMGLHADDEPELGSRPVIASLSLGESRIFRFKHKSDRGQKSARLPLEHGSLLVMSGDTQANYKHEVPKQSRPCGPRINLTFRQVSPVVP